MDFSEAMAQEEAPKPFVLAEAEGFTEIIPGSPRWDEILQSLKGKQFLVNLYRDGQCETFVDDVTAASQSLIGDPIGRFVLAGKVVGSKLWTMAIVGVTPREQVDWQAVSMRFYPQEKIRLVVPKLQKAKYLFVCNYYVPAEVAEEYDALLTQTFNEFFRL